MGDGALTKADMAERLFEELGLNKREAKEVVEQFLRKFANLWRETSKSNCPDMAILTLGTRNNALVEIQKPVKKSQLRPDV